MIYFLKIRSILGLTSHRLTLSKRKQEELDNWKIQIKENLGEEAAVNAANETNLFSALAQERDYLGILYFEYLYLLLLC